MRRGHLLGIPGENPNVEHSAGVCMTATTSIIWYTYFPPKHHREGISARTHKATARRTQGTQGYTCVTAVGGCRLLLCTVLQMEYDHQCFCSIDRTVVGAYHQAAVSADTRVDGCDVFPLRLVILVGESLKIFGRGLQQAH